ncbi:hypothetical protein [Actinosynnema sp. NPDC023587]|uniref:hypothetical protein n=1 Tax=Actinosynnema sp. NPDC023587 TaxID=3154695 RepID=UPI0033D4CC0C
MIADTVTGPVVMAYNIHGGVHYKAPSAAGRAGKVAADAGVTLLLVVLCAAGVKQGLDDTRYDLDDPVFTSTPDVCGVLRATPGLERWFPGAEERSPLDRGPGTRSCSWFRPERSDFLHVRVTLTVDARAAAEHMGPLRATTDRWSAEPGLGDEALTDLPASTGGKQELRTVVFRVRNAEVQVNHSRHDGERGPGLVDRALVMESAFAIEAQLLDP